MSNPLNGVLGSGGGGGGGTGTIGGSTGATDDAILIADGVGGATIAASAATLSASGKLTLPEAPYLTGVISPASVSTQQNDWAPSGGDTASVWRIQSSATVLITGISGGVAGRVLTLINIGANSFSLYPDHGSSIAANRFDLKVGGYSAVAVLPADSALTLWYDGTSSRWRAMTPTEGEVILGGASGNFARLSGTNSAGRAILDSPSGAAGGLITNTVYLGNSTSVDTAIERSAAGVVKVTDGSTGIRGLLGGGTSVASATALPVPTGRVFHVTGTTAITSITSTNLQAGAVITLIFDDVLTFTNGNNLKLAGDFTTSADDTITLAYDGTNWYECSRSVN